MLCNACQCCQCFRLGSSRPVAADDMSHPAAVRGRGKPEGGYLAALSRADRQMARW